MKKLLAMTAVALLMSTTAFAGSETKNLKLNTDVLASCQVSLDHDININYSPDSMSSVVTPINIICTEGTSYLFELSSGSSGDERNRKAKSIDGNSLNYKVNLVNIEDSVDSPLGAGANGVSLVGKGTMQTNQVIFIFPPNQFVAPGTYTDTLNMTVTY